MRSYLSDQSEWFGRQWNDFWFTPSYGKQLPQLRVAVCTLAAAWFTVSLFDSTWWYGDSGWLEGELARSLSSASEGPWGSRFRISLLWSASGPLAFQLWGGLGILLSVIGAVGIGGRVLQFALFLCALFLAQRLPWVTGAFEPALIAALGYLVIDPGQSFRGRGSSSLQPRWTATFVTRLLQVHTWMLIVAALASQLANIAWWQGEAVWWLAATDHSNSLTTDLLRGRILVVNALTHGITLCGFSAVFALWPHRLRPIGVLCGCILGGAYAVVGDQMLYGLLLIALLLGAFVDPLAVALPTRRAS